ncbi:MAG: hypothetical protein IIX03_01305, partial [Paludibacteraceae bacterium]|nr:hypothetical protein [Paludibacteraceae bacterium]
MEKDCRATQDLLAGARAVIARGYVGGNQIGGEGILRPKVATSDEDRERQEAAVETWARELGVWHDEATEELEAMCGERIANGSEAFVFFGDEQTVIKARDICGYDCLDVALVSMELHNALFPYTAMRITGFGRSEGDFTVIFEQKYIKGAKFAPSDLIARFMKTVFDAEKDDSVLGGNSYENDELLLQDL